MLRKAGAIILLLGLLMTLYTGFTYITREKVADIAGLELTGDKRHYVDWQPYVGIGAMVVGGVLNISGRKRTFAHRRQAFSRSSSPCNCD